MNTIDLLKEKSKLNENDEYILEYIQDHLEEIPHISSRELARRTYTSSTAVIRLARKLGFENYSEFKLNIITMLKSLNDDDLSLSNEDMLSIMSKMSSFNAKVIQQFKDELSIKTLSGIVELLSKTKYVDIIAKDINQSLAEYAVHVLWPLGKIVNVYDEDDKQLYYGLNVSNDHVVIIVSRSFTNDDYIHLLKTLNKRKIQTIVLTLNQDKRIEQLATYTISNFPYYETDLADLLYYSTLKYLIDIICATLLVQNIEQTKRLEKLYHQMFYNKGNLK